MSESAIACEPPRATGHPTSWAARASMSPADVVRGEVGGTMAWPAMPANSMRVRSSRNARAASWTGHTARMPKRASSSGWRGRPMVIGRRTSPASSDQRPRKGPTMRLQAPSSRPSEAAVSSTERASTAADPSSSGCASARSGCNHSSPWSASGSAASAGDPTPNGCTAEHTSCRKPGSVSSSVRVPPPGLSAASNTRTCNPARARVTAAVSPLGPDPTTAASSTPHLCRSAVAASNPAIVRPCD
jgi:hypothetical protein